MMRICTIGDGGVQSCQALDNLDEELKLSVTAEDHYGVVADDDDDDDDGFYEPNMKKMPSYDFKAYVVPDVSTFYREEPGTRKAVTPAFNGQAGKFVNMSPNRLNLFWDPNNGKPGHFISVCGPFESCGTATFPGHKFYFASARNPDDIVCRFDVKRGIAVYYFDPYSDGDDHEDGRGLTTESRDVLSLSDEDMKRYDAHVFNLEFGKRYKEFTGAEWLAMHPRNRPRHKIWRADYFGHEHTLETKETRFVELPPEDMLYQVSEEDMRRRSNTTEHHVPLHQYREDKPAMNLTLTALSCAPRIFEIKNFLSDVEADHILDAAMRKNLDLSTTGSAGSAKADTATRTSTNTWVNREESPIIDAVYRRAADVLRMDEALLRRRDAHEHPELGVKHSIAEPLQLVHYDPTQQYTAHHDFGFPQNKHPDNPSRSANLLLYLNGGMKGGETSFPRWLNGETSAPLNVKPEKGKAVLFYMVQPDGNLDDLTQHAALPVIEGEKWLANLWVWDPFRR